MLMEMTGSSHTGWFPDAVDIIDLELSKYLKLALPKLEHPKESRIG